MRAMKTMDIETRISEAEEKHAQTTALVKNLDTSVHTELATKASSDDVKTVDTKVAKVSTDLNKTINDLSMVRSELGTLIARNHEEIDVLRRQGERDCLGRLARFGALV
jgi:hypothetical protein